MKDLKGTQTYKNLEDAFGGESMAKNKYTFYAKKARQEGYVQVARFFEETARNEEEHAKIWFKYFHGIGTTTENLLDAAEGEKFEWTEMYYDYARVAREEGFEEIAMQMDNIGKVEKEHEERYRKLKDNIETGKVFERDEDVLWQCDNCGFVYKGKKAIEECPACKHPKGYFQIKAQNY